MVNLTISYRHLESSPALNEKINNKVKHLEKYFNDDFRVSWVCSIEGHMHSSDVNVHSKFGQFHATAHNENMYKTLDQCVHKIEKQLVRKDTKVKDHLHHRE